MDSKIFYILSIFFLSTATAEIPNKALKCSDFKPNVCGPNANCYERDHNRTVEVFGGAYCKCDAEFYGKPPNCARICEFDCKADKYCDSNEKLCKKGCRSHDECQKNEICAFDNQCKVYCRSNIDCETDEICDSDQQKCLKICECSSCGKNSVCEAADHTKICSCASGYYPKGSKGCRRRKIVGLSKDDELDCSKFCGTNSLCTAKEDKISCFCPANMNGNPFKACMTYLPPPQFIVKPNQEDFVLSLANVIGKH
ncbi:unnamed protein product [Chironomus riparius]|uniref:EGF-like domain-containing protein n=1 Tax=Chironomus riparius TaxID=315576 RepID=A0A9N9RHC0_9DIPT|nr:unnamed protein product [Chironomus riparius]